MTSRQLPSTHFLIKRSSNRFVLLHFPPRLSAFFSPPSLFTFCFSTSSKDDIRDWTKLEESGVYFTHDGDFAFAIRRCCPEAVTYRQRNLRVLCKTQPLFPNLSRCSIATTGSNWGLGVRRAYDASVSEYVVKPAFQDNNDNKCLSTLRPQLWKQLTEVCQSVDQLLLDCFPQHAVERMQRIRQQKIKTVDDTWCTNLYATHNYTSAPHVDRDDGRMLAVALFYEAHKNRCKYKHNSCAQDWCFVFPEWELQVPLRDGTVIFWNSEIRAHGTCCDGTKSEGCVSNRYVLVSQLKKNMSCYTYQADLHKNH